MFFFLLVVRFSVYTEDSHRKHLKLDVAIQEGEVPETSMQHSQADSFMFLVLFPVLHLLGQTNCCTPESNLTIGCI